MIACSCFFVFGAIGDWTLIQICLLALVRAQRGGGIGQGSGRHCGDRCDVDGISGLKRAHPMVDARHSPDRRKTWTKGCGDSEGEWRYLRPEQHSAMVNGVAGRAFNNDDLDQ